MQKKTDNNNAKAETRNTKIDFSGPRTFRMHTDFQPASGIPNARTLTAVNTDAVALLLKIKLEIRLYNMIKLQFLHHRKHNAPPLQI